MLRKLNCHAARIGILLTITALIAGMAGCDGYNPPPPSQNLEIHTWYDLDAIRDNLAGNHTLMNDLDSTTPGYEELASPTANGGKGWEPIGISIPMCPYGSFTGAFDGQGYEVRDLFINRPDEYNVGLFGVVEGYWEGAEGIGGVIKDIGVTNVTVIGGWGVGSLVGCNDGTVSNSYSSGNITGGSRVGGLVGDSGGTVTNCYSTGTVTGEDGVGGLVGHNGQGTVSNSYSSGSVTGYSNIGGLVGANADFATVSNSYSSGNITGGWGVGGLVGGNGYASTVSDSYSTGSVIGDEYVGGLVGSHEYSTVGNSYYNYHEVLINGENMITVGALFGEDFHQWLDNDKFSDVNERLSQENGYYVINSVSDFKQLLAFGQNATLTFRLTNDLDLGNELNFYIPYLAGWFDGNGHKILNLRLNSNLASPLGLFGYLAPGGTVHEAAVENVNITGCSAVGGLVGRTWEGTVSDSQSSGSVTGNDGVGGLVGESDFGTVSNSYSSASVTGEYAIGGLIGGNCGSVGNSYSTGSVTGEGHVGGLVGENYGTVDSSYSTASVTGNDGVGGLVGESEFGTVSNSYSSGNVIGDEYVGGLVGYNCYGTVSSSYSTGSVSGRTCVGGLVGCSEGGESKVEVCYSTATVVGNEHVGGLVGWGLDGAIMYWSYSTGSVAGTKWVGGLVGNLGSSDYLRGCSVEACYSTGSVTGNKNVGGLVGELKNQATVSDSFWDIQTSGQATSVGGTGKTTAEMKNIATFSGAGWNIIAVGLNETDSVYIWNIVDGVTYPFLNWQTV